MVVHQKMHSGKFFEIQNAMKQSLAKLDVWAALSSQTAKLQWHSPKALRLSYGDVQKQAKCSGSGTCYLTVFLPDATGMQEHGNRILMFSYDNKKGGVW